MERLQACKVDGGVTEEDGGTVLNAAVLPLWLSQSYGERFCNRDKGVQFSCYHFPFLSLPLPLDSESRPISFPCSSGFFDREREIEREAEKSREIDVWGQR